MPRNTDATLSAQERRAFDYGARRPARRRLGSVPDLDVFWATARAAYRRRAWAAHPDRGGSNEAMAALSDALEVVRQHLERERKLRGDVAYAWTWRPVVGRRRARATSLRKAR